MGLARAGGRALAAGERRLPTLERGLGCVVLKLPVETPEQLNAAEHEAPARKLSGATGFVADTPDPLLPSPWSSLRHRTYSIVI